MRRALAPVAGVQGLPLLGLAVVVACTAGLLAVAGGLPTVDPGLFPFLEAQPSFLEAGERPGARASQVVSEALVARFTWASAEITLTVLLVAALGLALTTVRRCASERDRTPSLVLLAALSGGAFATVALLRGLTETIHGVAGMYAGDLFRTIHEFEKSALQFGDQAFLDWTAFTRLTDPLGAAAVVSLALAFCALSHRIGDLDREELRDRHRRMEVLLALAAALLAAFVLEIHTLVRWPEVALDPGGLPAPGGDAGARAPGRAADHIRRMGNAFAASAGFLFSLALLAVAGPALWRLREEARSRAGRAKRQGDADRAGGSAGRAGEADGVGGADLGVGILRRIVHALLILVPTMAGVAGHPVGSALARALGLG